MPNHVSLGDSLPSAEENSSASVSDPGEQESRSTIPYDEKCFRLNLRRKSLDPAPALCIRPSLFLMIEVSTAAEYRGLVFTTTVKLDV